MYPCLRRLSFHVRARVFVYAHARACERGQEKGGSSCERSKKNFENYARGYGLSFSLAGASAGV